MLTQMVPFKSKVRQVYFLLSSQTLSSAKKTARMLSDFLTVLKKI